MIKKLRKMLYITLGLVGVLLLGTLIFIHQPQFGKNPTGERLKRIQGLPNYKNGRLQNLSETPEISSDKNIIELTWDFLFKRNKNLSPSDAIPIVKTDLKTLPLSENLLVWLGHSSYYIQLDGKRFLIDPTLVSASPIDFFNQAFKGADFYKPEHMPEIDYLIITHDHWDHLDYHTIKAMKSRIKQVITGIGVGEHFEYWGFSPSQIIEMNWNEQVNLLDDIKITSLPARHYSGRGILRGKTLWASFMLQSKEKTIYIGGDSGYDEFYKQIKEQFSSIDFAILENGQYGEDWVYIHSLPRDFKEIAKILNAKYTLGFHNSKYALANHHWKEPMEKAVESAKQNGQTLLTPKIGEIVYLDDRPQNFSHWWETIQ